MASAAGFIQALPEQYHTLAGDLGNKLSGGQVRRLALEKLIKFLSFLLALDVVCQSGDCFLKLIDNCLI